MYIINTLYSYNGKSTLFRYHLYYLYILKYGNTIKFGKKKKNCNNIFVDFSHLRYGGDIFKSGIKRILLRSFTIQLRYNVYYPSAAYQLIR